MARQLSQSKYRPALPCKLCTQRLNCFPTLLSKLSLRNKPEPKETRAPPLSRCVSFTWSKRHTCQRQARKQGAWVLKFRLNSTKPERSTGFRSVIRWCECLPTLSCLSTLPSQGLSMPKTSTKNYQPISCCCLFLDRSNKKRQRRTKYTSKTAGS